jgi:hypothetical protein
MSEYNEKFVNDKILAVMGPEGDYKTGKDFISLKAWKKAKEVKLFFYKNILPKIPKY